MDTKAIEIIRQAMEKKTTEELRKIYEEHNTNEWREDAFEAIILVLKSRDVAIPVILPIQGKEVTVSPPLSPLPDASSQPDVAEEQRLPILISIIRSMFGFSGRISRQDCWMKGMLPLLAIMAVSVAVFRSIGILVKGRTTPIPIDLFAVGALCLLAFWVFLALSIKRLNDRNKSPAWLLVLFAPFVAITLLLMAIDMASSFFDTSITLNVLMYGIIPCLLYGIIPWFVADTFWLKGTEGTNKHGVDPVSPRLSRALIRHVAVIPAYLRSKFIAVCSFSINIYRHLAVISACLLPLLYLLWFTQHHNDLNAKADLLWFTQHHNDLNAKAGQPDGAAIIMFKNGLLSQLSGSWSWRFFYSGQVSPYLSTWNQYVIEQGVPVNATTALDFTNPTPCLIFCWICVIPLTVLRSSDNT